MIGDVQYGLVVPQWLSNEVIRCIVLELGDICLTGLAAAKPRNAHCLS